MEGLNLLESLQACTAELVSVRLRSDSVVISKLCALIEAAHQFGHSHKSIHASIEAGGLPISWNSYRIALMRARKALRARSVAKTSSMSPARSAEPSMDAVMTARTVDVSRVAGTPVLDALASARLTATKDYARIARDLARKDRP